MKVSVIFLDEEFESVPSQKKAKKAENQNEKPASKDSFDFDDEDDVVVEDEGDDDVSHFIDNEEFEGFDPDYPASKRSSPDLVINEVQL